MKKYLIITLVVFAMLLLLSSAVQAAIEAFELTWYTVDAGGGTSQGGSYTLSGTIGQPDADSLTGGDYRLDGGFWSEATSARVFLPIVNR
jgi:hypothetical protein